MDGLGRESEVAHHRDAELGEAACDLDHRSSPLELDRVHARLLEEPSRADDRLLRRRVVGHERHVADQQCLARAPSHRLRVVEHVLQGHRQRRRIAEHHHAEAVADKQDRKPSLIEDLRAEVVVSGQDRKAPTFVLESLDVQHSGHRFLLRVAATSGVSALVTSVFRVRSAAAGSSPACRAISSATRASIR